MKTLNRIGLAFLFLTQLSLSGFAQSGGLISTVAGNGTQGFGGDGGPATSAQVNQPEGVAVDSAGNLYIADTVNNRIRKVTPAGVISTVAGNGAQGFSGDGGPMISAALYDPSGVAFDLAGNLYIADFNNHRIRKVTPEGVISTVAGGGTQSPGDGGPATSAALLGPGDVAVDRVGNLYLSENGGFGNPPHRVRKVTPGGVISTVAGGGTQSPGDGGPATSAQLGFVGDVAVDSAGNLYIADYERIRKVTPGGVISTVAGNGTSGYGGDGGSATSAQLNGPGAIAVDSAGNLYIVDSGNNRIRKVESAYTPQTEEVFIPIVLSSGGMNESFYTSEMTLTNRGTANPTINFAYTSAIGSGSGTGMDTLAPGQQMIVPDAISYLRSLGVPIPSFGSQGGTLRVTLSDLTSPADGGVTVRTTTVVPEGRAGLAYAGIPVSMALTGPSYLCGLRQNETDRSNVALQNVGTAEDGNITLQLTVFSGAGGTLISRVLPEQVLAPGGFAQISGILTSNGLSLSNGYVRVERTSGTAPYYAYGVINDQANSDGSFILPVLEGAMAGKTRMTLPVVVETSAFSTELVVTNWGSAQKTLNCHYVADAIQTADHTASFTIELNPHQQLILPDSVQWMRDSQVPGIGPRGTSSAGALTVSVNPGDLSGVMMAARTSSLGGGGRYGLYYTAIPEGESSSREAWLYGLQQDGENRTNLALVNTGEMDDSEDTFNLELYDGETGTLANTVTGVTLPARGWKQLNMTLAEYAPQVRQGYAHVVRTGGNNPFIAYAVINDGAQPGQRSGDGAFIASTP